MNYAEAAYFDGNHCAHVAAYEEAKRLDRIRSTTAAHFQRLPLAERRRGGRTMIRK
jgi:hypothetical protein